MQNRGLIVTLVLASICCYQTVRAADHIDGPRASADPAADITDVFTWMTADAARVIIAIDLTRNATTDSRFSDAVVYATRTHSSATFGGTTAAQIDVSCTFSANQEVQCWVGDEAYVAGDASGTEGITSADGKLRVFTGLRQDPFFFNLAGFRETCRIVAGAASGLTFDPAGCPALDEATATALVTQLQSAPGGGPAPDSFATFNVISIVLEIDKSLLTSGGPILAVETSTNQFSICGDPDQSGAPGVTDGVQSLRAAAGLSNNCTIAACDVDGSGTITVTDGVNILRAGAGLPSESACPAPSATVPPARGVQIERMGRPGINTAVTNPFFRESVDSEKEHHEEILDEYNAASDPSQWTTLFPAEMAANLAILDGLDRNCGNQLLAGPSPVAGRYDALAGVLADDQLYLNTASGTCAQYLAVEANAVGIPNTDCGGRTPLEDSIDTTYSLLAAGVLTGVTDGVPVDADSTPSLTVFPYLDDPT
jgi:hypothetical protein